MPDPALFGDDVGRWVPPHKRATDDPADTYPGSLYGGVPPHEQVSTSAAAAHSVATIANTVRGRVLGFIRDRGEAGATDDEIEVALELRHQTASARRRELYLLGEIRSIGERRTRSGRRAKVWGVVV